MFYCSGEKAFLLIVFFLFKWKHKFKGRFKCHELSLVHAWFSLRDQGRFQRTGAGTMKYHFHILVRTPSAYISLD